MKLLSLEWTSKGRDIDITEPVLYFLEKFYNFTVIRESIYQFEFKILKYKPDILLIANGVGAPNNFNVVKFAKSLGIKVVTLISEGDYIDNPLGIEAFFWGWNKDKILYEDLHLEWSTKNVNILKKYLKHLNFNKIKVSGATGFDKYKFLSFMDKNTLLDKYNLKSFQKVILIAAWGFDNYFTDYLEKNKQEIVKRFGSLEIVEKIKSNRDPLNEIYKKLIENNPDILFILKYHPGTVDKNETEFKGLLSYKNVLVIHREENIFDLINASDLLVAFESTTALEAWLLNKMSVLVTPNFGDFERSIISQGSPITKTYEELQKYIDEFYQTNKIEDFLKLSDRRKEIIKNIIEFDDGKNHIRAANYIAELANNEITKNKNFKILLTFIIKAIFRGFIIRTKLYKLKYFKKFSQDLWIKNQFDFKERRKIYELYKENLEKFYNKFGIEI